MLKKSTYTSLLVAGGLFLCITLGACKDPDPNEEFIQGTWHFSQQVDENFSSSLDWTFDNGQFSVEGYPPLIHKGKYTVSKTLEDKVTLHLTDQQGDWPIDDRHLPIEIIKEKDQIMIDSKGPYTRVKKED